MSNYLTVTVTFFRGLRMATWLGVGVILLPEVLFSVVHPVL